MKIITGKIISVILLFITTEALATTYPLPNDNESLIGEVKSSPIRASDTPALISQKYDIGFNSLQNANPQLDLNRYPVTGELQIPTQHLLPPLPREGIVINLPEMRMYYYPHDSNSVITYPIGIGKIGQTIPITKAKITYKKEKPNWIPTENIRHYNLTQGIILPQIMPPGPDNPLGPYAIYTSIPTYLMHSTIFPESIGRRASFGCIRMYRSDVEELFPVVTRGLPVVIINDPVKIGWKGDRLLMENYPPLEEQNNETPFQKITRFLSTHPEQKNLLVDWQAIAYINEEQDGLPHEIGKRLN